MDQHTHHTHADVKPSQTPQEMQQDSLLASRMERTSPMSRKKNYFAIGAVVAILLGLGTGYVGAAMTKAPTTMTTQPTGPTGTTVTANTPTIQVGQVFGSKDTSSFKDSAEGVVLPGGIGSEGSHHLVRAGGASQNVYLTSSVLDLKMFENAKVKVYGETFAAQKAGWLMDVGRVEVEDLNAPLPDWAAKLQQQQQNSTGNQD